MDTLAVVIVALATYRVATDLAWEDGPFELYAWLRGQVLMRFGATSWLTNGFGCPICLSFWIAPVMIVLWVRGAELLVLWLAVAGTAALLARLPK